MNCLREVRRLLQWAAAVSIASTTFFAAPVQAATATFSGCTSGNTYTGVTFDGSGNVTVTCTSTPPAGGPGTIAFSQATYTGNMNSNVSVTLNRSNGSAGTATASLSVTGGCGVPSPVVTWGDGDSAAKSVNVTTPASTTSCPLSAAVATTAGSTTISATVSVVDPANPQPGTFAFSSPQSGPVAGGPGVTFQITRSGGSAGTYDIAFSVVNNGLTGHSLLDGTGPAVLANPIRFADGQTSKSFTLVPGSTAGSIVINITSITPVAPTTATIPTFGPFTITVSNTTVGNCPAPASNVIVIPDMPVGEGQWILANAGQGKIVSAKMPAIPASVGAGVITQSATQGTSPMTRIEMAMSKCPGDFTYYLSQPRVFPGQTYYPCYVSSPVIFNNTVRWHLTAPNHYAYCYAPNEQGPWYINLRYELPNGCPYGADACGSSIQWNRP